MPTESLRTDTPDGRGFPVDALHCWWQVVGQAAFWRGDHTARRKVATSLKRTSGARDIGYLPMLIAIELRSEPRANSPFESSK